MVVGRASAPPRKVQPAPCQHRPPSILRAYSCHAVLARTGLPRTALIKMIALSFIVASKREFVARKLTIVVHPGDLDRVNLYDLEDFLRSACF